MLQTFDVVDELNAVCAVSSAKVGR